MLFMLKQFIRTEVLDSLESELSLQMQIFSLMEDKYSLDVSQVLATIHVLLAFTVSSDDSSMKIISDKMINFPTVESVRENRFFGLRCATANDALLNRCTSEPGAWFGGEPSNAAQNTFGIFRFTTNNNSPFGNGAIKP